MPYIAMPVRTRSKWDSGTVSVAGELAMCRTSGSTPSFSAYATIARYTSSWAAIEGWPGSSAQAKWDQSPVIRRCPARSAASASPTSSGQSAGWQPLRPSPVSALSWTRAGRPAAPAAATTSRSAHRPLTDTSMSASTASRQGPPGVHSQHMIRPPSPAARRANASCGVAVPSQAAPASRAASAQRTAPWPYPSDFTTAMSCAPAARSRRARTLARSAARSISARALRDAVSFIAPSLSEAYAASGAAHAVVRAYVRFITCLRWSSRTGTWLSATPLAAVTRVTGPPSRTRSTSRSTASVCVASSSSAR